jgi:hypothetical protein
LNECFEFDFEFIYPLEGEKLLKGGMLDGVRDVRKSIEC